MDLDPSGNEAKKLSLASRTKPNQSDKHNLRKIPVRPQKTSLCDL